MTEENQMTTQNITSVSGESSKMPPPAEFKSQASIGSFAEYRRLYNESVNAPEKFWSRQAKELLLWKKPWKKVLDWKPPFAKWFVGGKLNVAENCLDRHVEASMAFPNPFGGAPIKGTSRVKMLAHDAEAKTISVETEDRTDPRGSKGFPRARPPGWC